MEIRAIQWPEDAGRLAELKSGDLVELSGVIYTARDAAHRRLVDLLAAGSPPPFPLTDAAIYYAGPSPCPPGRPIGAIGPTTASRMDPFKERLLQAGMKLMIGKGPCMPELRELCRRYQAVYLAAPGGVAALTARCVRAAELIAWPELGAEAVRRLEVERMQLVVVNDTAGNDYYQK